MKIKSAVLAVFAVATVGAITVKTVHAQEPVARKPHAYYVSEFEITGSEGMKPYSARGVHL